MVIIFIDAAVKSLLILSFGAVFCVCLRRASAATRHLIWVATLVSVISAPVFTWTLPSAFVLSHWNQIAAEQVPVHTVVPTANDDEHRAERLVASNHRAVRQRQSPIGEIESDLSTSPQLRSASVTASNNLAGHLATNWQVGSMILAIWGFGTGLLLLPLVFGQWACFRLTKAFPAVTNGELLKTTHAIAAELRIKSPRLHFGDDDAMPMVWGVADGHLLLPNVANAWDATRQRAVLLHELAHLRRHDPLTMIIGQLARAIYWFNPLTWLAVTQMRTERERACDDFVLRGDIKPSDYAAILLELSSTFCRRKSDSITLSMADASRIESRLRAVLDVHQNRDIVPGRVVAATLIIATSVTISTSMLRAADKCKATTNEAKLAALTNTPGASAALPTAAEIQAAYRQNFADMFPLGITYRLSQIDGIGDVEDDRANLRKQEFIALSLANAEDVKFDGRVPTPAELVHIKQYCEQQIKDLKQCLHPETVEQRLCMPSEGGGYFWTDQKAIHLRCDDGHSNTSLFPGPINPPENLRTLYHHVRVASWSESNKPPIKIWLGRGQGIITSQPEDLRFIRSLAPVGFVRPDCIATRIWNEFDLFMSADQGRIRVIERAELNRQSVIVVEDSQMKNPFLIGASVRARAWIDPNQGFLPLRMEWWSIDANGDLRNEPDQTFETLKIRKIANGFYPTLIRRQDYKWVSNEEPMGQEEQADRNALSNKAVSRRLPGNLKILQVTELVPRQQIEPGALELIFPEGTRYLNNMDGQNYRFGSPDPLPPPVLPVEPGEVAPTWNFFDWTDGKSRQLTDYLGKVVFLFSWDCSKHDFESLIRMQKTLQAQYADQDVVMFGMHPGGTAVSKISEYQHQHNWKVVTGVDIGHDGETSPTLLKYTAGASGLVVIIGRDGRVTFNMAASEAEEEFDKRLEKAADSLGVQWPLNDSDAEKATEESERVLERMFSQIIDEAVLKRD